MLFQTVLITLPVFLIIAAGWFFRKTKIVDEDFIASLNVFAYYVSLPALIISGFWGADFRSGGTWQTILLSALVSLAFSTAVFLVLAFLKLKRKTKAAIFLVSTVGNTVYMGLPLAEFVFGKGALGKGVLASVALLVIPILISIFALKFWHDKEIRMKEQLLQFVKNPLFVSFILGIILGVLGLKGFGFEGVKKTFSMLGATASPVALFALGAFLCGKFLKKDLFAVFASSIVKVVVFPVAGILSFGKFLGADSGIYALFLAMPVAVTTFVIAEKYELDKDLVANSILVSVIISFFTVPMTVLFFR